MPYNLCFKRNFWLNSYKKTKTAIDEYYNDLVADINEKELIAKKKPK
ncbi:MAG: hypothetical protein LBV52_00945 [Spirochaetaceae bacterium]|nr:hypothetical protein [Spirochaetaceae bacterium]